MATFEQFTPEMIIREVPGDGSAHPAVDLRPAINSNIYGEVRRTPPRGQSCSSATGGWLLHLCATTLPGGW